MGSLPLEMFEAIKGKLDSLDAVLDEALLESKNKYDIERGFDPSKTYDELGLLDFEGLDALKRGTEDACYVLLEVKLRSGSNEFTKLYLRGFENCEDFHRGPIFNYLCEMSQLLPNEFNIPTVWPGDTEHPPKSINLEVSNTLLEITVVGGGKFDLKNGKINTHGQSTSFGPIPNEYKGRLIELFGLLVQKPAYKGYVINI